MRHSKYRKCPLCIKSVAKKDLIQVPMNFYGVWELFNVHKKCEAKHKKKYSRLTALPNFICYKHGFKTTSVEEWDDHCYSTGHIIEVQERILDKFRKSARPYPKFYMRRLLEETKN